MVAGSEKEPCHRKLKDESGLALEPSSKILDSKLAQE